MIKKDTADHWDHLEDKDYFSQPGKIFRLMNTDQKNALFENRAREIAGAYNEVKYRHI